MLRIGRCNSARHWGRASATSQPPQRTASRRPAGGLAGESDAHLCARAWHPLGPACEQKSGHGSRGGRILTRLKVKGCCMRRCDAMVSTEGCPVSTCAARSRLAHAHAHAPASQLMPDALMRLGQSESSARAGAASGALQSIIIYAQHALGHTPCRSRNSQAPQILRANLTIGASFGSRVPRRGRIALACRLAARKKSRRPAEQRKSAAACRLRRGPSADRISDDGCD